MRERSKAVQEALAGACRVLDAERGSACLVDEGGVIAHCNPAWDAFARENGGAPAALARVVVGRTWLSFLDGDAVRNACEPVLYRALAGEPQRIDGECNTPSVGRLPSTALQPIGLPGERGRVVGVALIHTITRVVPIVQVYAPVAPDLARFTRPDGLIHMCCSCRRVRGTRPSDEGWHFVPELVARRRANVTHGFCETCFGLQFHAKPG